MQIWVVSDWHLGHDNACLKFKRRDGTPLRDFPNAEVCDEHMIALHNALVKPSDHVYMLGDVAIRREHLWKVSRFHGHKRLVRGNHDIFRTKDYLEAGFEEIHGCRVLDNVMMTHVPIHPDCLGRFRGNLHGHIHANPLLPGEHDPAGYLNVGVERLDFAPITLEEAANRLARNAREGQALQAEAEMPIAADLVEEIPKGNR